MSSALKSSLLIAAITLTSMGMGSDKADALTVMVWPPAGFTGYLTYIENGEFDPTSPNPDVPGCFQFMCDGDYFHQTIMGRTPMEADALELEAKQFFIDSFGVDVDDPANASKLFFRRYYRDPRADLRAYVVSGAPVRRDGWQVHDGGWAVFFLEDFALGGEHAGEMAVKGTSLEWGEHMIEVRRGRGHHRRRHRHQHGSIVIAYRSGVVTATAPNGIRAFQCEIFAGRIEDAGGGWGDAYFPHQGYNEGLMLTPTATADPGVVRANARHTLTFSPLGGL